MTTVRSSHVRTVDSASVHRVAGSACVFINGREKVVNMHHVSRFYISQWGGREKDVNMHHVIIKRF